MIEKLVESTFLELDDVCSISHEEKIKVKQILHRVIYQTIANRDDEEVTPNS